MKIGWVDFSKSDKAKVNDIIKIFKTKGAVDELGFGAIRDAFANKFFPGTTTVQTRAKYFCREVYMLKMLVDGEFGKKYGYEKDKVISDIDKAEKMYAGLLEKNNRNENGGPVTGIIGIDRIRNNAWVDNKPHEIYWTGLRQLGIFDYKGMSFDAFVNVVCKNLQEKASLGRISQGDDSAEKDIDNKNKLYVMKLPENVSDKELKCKSIKLTIAEAEFLKERITTQQPNTLFSFLIERHLNDIDECVKDKDDKIESDNVFSILYRNIEDELPEDIKEYMKFANEANNLMCLAKLRYNVILEEKRNEKYRKGKKLCYEFAEKWQAVENNLKDYITVDIDKLFELLCLNRLEKLKTFCLKFKSKIEEIVNAKESTSKLKEELYKQLDELIIKRECDIKKTKRAKLVNPPRGDNSVGDLYLDFRLKTALTIIKDIAEPLPNTEESE